MEDIELHVRNIKNGFIVWNNHDFDSIFCTSTDDVIKVVTEKLRKYVK